MPDWDGNDNVVMLGPRSTMSPEQVLAVCAKEPWESVIIIGFWKNDEQLTIRSANVTREFANWIIDHAKREILGWDGG